MSAKRSLSAKTAPRIAMQPRSIGETIANPSLEMRFTGQASARCKRIKSGALSFNCLCYLAQRTEEEVTAQAKQPVRDVPQPACEIVVAPLATVRGLSLAVLNSIRSSAPTRPGPGRSDALSDTGSAISKKSRLVAANHSGAHTAFQTDRIPKNKANRTDHRAF